MSSSERRVDTRLNIRVPLRFRKLNQTGAVEQIAESENVSQRGVYFYTHVALKIGAVLELTLRIPKELFGRMSGEVKCIARIIHIRQGALPGDKAGIGLHIERYETAIVQPERWAS